MNTNTCAHCTGRDKTTYIHFLDGSAGLIHLHFSQPWNIFTQNRRNVVKDFGTFAHIRPRPHSAKYNT